MGESERCETKNPLHLMWLKNISVAQESFKGIVHSKMNTPVDSNLLSWVGYKSRSFEDCTGHSFLYNYSEWELKISGYTKE